ncbi:DNA polymerase III subunit epsilon [Algihabitans albus]|uniref:DNA polymerase III subunit epsilon n=1 Tax=Algihabitans albus TaxID=2164067 RepID=UPI000E5CD3E8|nr:DNA polymerase III subunit epsilon [Algihabitans albus]
MREIVLDTETTGLDPLQGHRVIELAALELVNHMATGRSWREYIDPEREVEEDARRVHGIDNAFLEGKPKFAAVAEGFLEFLGDAAIVAHNAAFDLGFLKAELLRLGKPELPNPVIDTLAMARQRFPGSPNSLDALCRRFEIDNSSRSYHGALLDCELLAEVYLELKGGRQPGLSLADERAGSRQGGGPTLVSLDSAGTKPRREPRPHAATAEELEAHKAMLEGIKDPLWGRG